MKTLVKLALLLLPMTAFAQGYPPVVVRGPAGSSSTFPFIFSPPVIFTSDADHTMVYPEMSGSGGTIIVTSTPSLTATRNLLIPATGNFNWVIRNKTTGGQTITVKVSGGTGVSIANGSTSSVMCDSVNCYTSSVGGTITAVQYNPANTLYVFTGNSVLGDDPGVLGPYITVTSGTCNGTVCTIQNSGTNGLAAGDWIYCGMTGFPGAPSPFGNVSTTYQMFQVLSAGLTSSQFKFNYTLGTATVTGGVVQKGNYLLAQQVMQQPFFEGHGNFQVITDSAYTVAGINTDYTTLFHSISPAVTGNNPEYLIINDIFNNDLQFCASAATIESNLQSLWQKAHTDGWIVVQGTATAVPYNSSSCATAYTNANAVNNWLYGQGKQATNTTGLYAGEFWDTLADVGAVLSNPIDTTLIATNGGMAPGGVQPYAQTLNEAMASQASATKAKSYVYYGASAVGGNTRGEVHTPLSDSYHAFVVTDAAQDTEDITIDTLRHLVTANNLYWQTSTGQNTGNYAVTQQDYMGNLSPGRPQCHVMGVQNATLQHAYMCFNYVGSGSANNNLVIGLHGDVNYLSQWPSDPYNFVYYPDGSFMPPGGVLGPATAPGGSCTRTGAFISSQDGKITYCPASGTWTSFTASSGVPTVNASADPLVINGAGVSCTITSGTQTCAVAGGGTTTNALTAAASGGAAPGSTFNGSAAVTFDYHSVGASPLAGSTSLTTLGTITTGVWNGTALTSTYLPAATVYNNQANAYTTGLQDFSAVTMKLPTSYTEGSGPYTITQPGATGTLALTSQIGSWGALNYPTWSSGTPFVKMTAAGTFALDTNTYLTSSTGLLATGATTGATSQAQTFTDGVIPSNLTVGYVPYAESSDKKLVNSPFYTDGTNVGIGTVSPSALLSVGSTSQFQVNSSGVMSAAYGSTAANSGGTQEAICLADGTNCPGGTVTTSGSPVSPNIAAFSSGTAITAATSANIQTAIGAGVYDASGAAAARQANLSLLPGTYTNGDMCTYASTGTLLNCNTAIPTVGSWGALNYPTWASGTPFVKMTAAGTFSLDTNTYGTFTLPSLTSGSVLFSNGSTIAQDNSNFFWDSTNHRLGIGTTAPVALLNAVSGVTDFRWSTGANAVTPTMSVINTNTGGKAAALLAGTAGSVFEYDSAGYFQIDSNAHSAFTGNTNGTGATARFRIGANGGVSIGSTYAATDPGAGSMIISGNVGIGTTTPAALLSVGSSSQFQVNSSGVMSAAYGSTAANSGGTQTAICLADVTGGCAVLNLANNFSVAGVASTPAMKLTGSWFQGGSSTTTKPQLLIEPAGTTSTGWHTQGTGLGINVPSASAYASAIDAQSDGVSLWRLDAAGNVHTNSAIPTSSLGTVTGSNAGGFVSGLTAATAVTITFAASPWSLWASCTATPSVTGITVYNSSQSTTSVTFSMAALTGTLYYSCTGN